MPDCDGTVCDFLGLNYPFFSSADSKLSKAYFFSRGLSGRLRGLIFGLSFLVRCLLALFIGGYLLLAGLDAFGYSGLPNDSERCEGSGDGGDGGFSAPPKGFRAAHFTYGIIDSAHGGCEALSCGKNASAEGIFNAYDDFGYLLKVFTDTRSAIPGGQNQVLQL